MRWAATCIVLTLFAGPVGAEAPAPRVALSAERLQTLKALLRVDPGAARIFADQKLTAARALGDRPQPLKRIVSEGRLHSDPEKIRGLAARRDLFKIEALGYAFALTEELQYGEKAREFVLAWARVYESDGNPINETEFVRLMKGYDLTRGMFSPGERAEVEGWFLRTAAKERNEIRPQSSAARNNHMSHRLKIVGYAAYVAGEPALARWVAAEYKRHVERNLNADGSSFDFHQRDALHYHVYDVLPLVELSIAAAENGERLYDYAAPSGATLEKSIAFLIPYIEGEKTHREFVRSTVKFDRERSAAGDPTIRVGALWNAEEARRLFDLAGYFSPRFHAVNFPGGASESFERLLATLGGDRTKIKK